MTEEQVPRTSWEVGYRMRVTMLTEENRRLTEELAGVRERFEELKLRAGRVWEICQWRYADDLAQRLVRVLDDDPHEFNYGRCAGGAVTADAGGDVPAGGVCGAPDSGGDDGVPGPVEAVAAWPYTGSGGAEHELVGGVTP